MFHTYDTVQKKLTKHRFSYDDTWISTITLQVSIQIFCSLPSITLILCLIRRKFWVDLTGSIIFFVVFLSALKVHTSKGILSSGFRPNINSKTRKKDPNKTISPQSNRKNDDLFLETIVRFLGSGCVHNRRLCHQVVVGLPSRSSERDFTECYAATYHRTHVEKDERRKAEETTTNGNRGRDQSRGTGIEGWRQHMEMAPCLALRSKFFPSQG